MTYGNLLKLLRNDLRDETELNLIFSDYQLMQFLYRGLCELNDMTAWAKKQGYIVLENGGDIVDLPSDYIDTERLYDLWNKREMTTTDLSEKWIKTEGYPYSYQIDETRRRLMFDYIPIDGSYKTPYKYKYLNTTKKRITIGGNATDGSFDNWWESPFVMMVAGTVTEYWAINKTLSIGALAGTLTVVDATTLTMPSTASSEDDYYNGMTITIGSNNYVVSDYNGTTKTVTTTGVSEGAGTYTFSMVEYKFLYYGERNVSQTGQATPVINTTLIYNVDYLWEYVYEPADNCHLSTRTATGTTTTLTLSGIDTLIRNGCKIFVPRTANGLMFDGDSATVVSGEGTTSIVIDEAFPDALSSSTYYVLDVDLAPPTPQETHRLIVYKAAVYAWLRKGQKEKSDIADRLVEEKMKDYKLQQAREKESFNSKADSATVYHNGRRRGWLV